MPTWVRIPALTKPILQNNFDFFKNSLLRIITKPLLRIITNPLLHIITAIRYYILLQPLLRIITNFHYYPLLYHYYVLLHIHYYILLQMHYHILLHWLLLRIITNSLLNSLLRKVADISRSQYEVYSFATKHNLSEAAVDGDAKQCMYLIMCCIEKSSWNPSARINVH